MQVWPYIILGIIIITILGLVLLSHWLDKGSDKIRRDYYLHTETCQTCYGRGRVPKQGWYFPKDKYQERYDSRKALEGVPESIRKAFKEKIDE